MNCYRPTSILVLVVALALAACGGSDAPSSADSGSAAVDTPGRDAQLLTITVADSEPDSRPTYAALLEFERLVETRSAGSIEVELRPDFGKEPPQGSDEDVIDALRTGAVEIAVVPARAWSLVGIDSFRPLQMPFLVESEAHADAIAADADVVADLQADLTSVGVRGLMMYPDSLRHLFSYTTPILAPGDLTGRGVRYVASQEVAAMIEALGGTPMDPSDEEHAALIDDGSISAFDSSFSFAKSGNPRPGIATGNLVLYSKMITFAANGEFWESLTDEQRSILEEAAGDMQTWAIDNRPADAQSAAGYCDEGGSVVVIDDDSKSAFRLAVEPLYNTLEQDPDAARVVQAIEALRPSAEASPVAPCDARAVVLGYHELEPSGGELPDGVYQVEFTDEHLRAHGLGESSVQNNHGVWTIRMENGNWHVDQVAPDITDSWYGIYQVDEDVLHFGLSPNEGVIDLYWSVADDGSLTFTEVNPTTPPDFGFVIPWSRVGDL